MLERWFPNQMERGAVQCLIAALIAALVILLVRRRAPNLVTEVFVAELRGLLQIIAVGTILAFMLRGPQWTAIFVLAGMPPSSASEQARFRVFIRSHWRPSRPALEAFWQR
jgi:putative ABC transport system permease protein